MDKTHRKIKTVNSVDSAHNDYLAVRCSDLKLVNYLHNHLEKPIGLYAI